MKTTAVLLVLAFSALALAETKPPGTMVPAHMTGTTATQKPKPTTASTTKPTTTKPTTTKPTTTTAHTTKPNTTTAHTTKPKTTTAHTTKPKTTTAHTTKPTTKPTTHTTKPTTTTPKPTTHAPTTTTTIAPTTTQPPKPTNSTVGNYTLDNGKHRCLMVQMELKIRIASPKANGTFLLLPNKTRTGGKCNDDHATLYLISDELNITLSYKKNVTMKKFFVNRLAFNLTHDFSKKVNAATTYKVVNESIEVFEANIGKSYSCRKESLFMGQGLYLDIAQDRMQAFNFTNNLDFGPTDPCPADQNNYRVAIAVGITLLVLVVVVVVVYLVARKKRTDGYQSL